MAYFAIEHIRNERKRIRNEAAREASQRTLDLVLTELEQRPDASSEDIKKAVEDALQEADS